MASLEDFQFAQGEWWCPKCSRAHLGPLARDPEAPECPRCGTQLEASGTGDDDPYPEDEL